jgi:hypothetical protein
MDTKAGFAQNLRSPLDFPVMSAEQSGVKFVSRRVERLDGGGWE